jgi:hypothetical protein
MDIRLSKQHWCQPQMHRLLPKNDMTKQKSTAPPYVTKEILRKEINRLDAKIDGVEHRLDAKIDGVEHRLDAKIDSKVDAAVQSMKEYTDSRFNQSDAKTDVLDAKMTKYFELMMQTITGFQKEIKSILTNHEKRITVLEEKE